MGNRFASGKRAIAECDRCAQRFKLTELTPLVVKTKPTGLLVCRECNDPDHPQLLLGMTPVDDPQGLRNPRPDRSFGPGGSRSTQWGWNPVGGGNSYASNAPNNLALVVALGTIAVTVS